MTATGFIFAWLPFSVLSVWETFYPPTEIPAGLSCERLLLSCLQKEGKFISIFPAYRVAASLFCKSATAFNPFIYFFLSQGFRRDLMRLLRDKQEAQPAKGGGGSQGKRKIGK